MSTSGLSKFFLSFLFIFLGPILEAKSLDVRQSLSAVSSDGIYDFNELDKLIQDGQIGATPEQAIVALLVGPNGNLVMAKELANLTNGVSDAKFESELRKKGIRRFVTDLTTYRSIVMSWTGRPALVSNLNIKKVPLDLNAPEGGKRTTTVYVYNRFDESSDYKFQRQLSNSTDADSGMEAEVEGPSKDWRWWDPFCLRNCWRESVDFCRGFPPGALRISCYAGIGVYCAERCS